MDTILKAAAGVLVALMLYLTLIKSQSDFALLITLAVCCMLGSAALKYLSPVIDFFGTLQDIANLDPDLIVILLKSVGISLLSEMTGMICTDAGNAALGKTLQVLATAVILYLSLPLFTGLIELVEKILITL